MLLDADGADEAELLVLGADAEAIARLFGAGEEAGEAVAGNLFRRRVTEHVLRRRATDAVDAEFGESSSRYVDVSHLRLRLPTPEQSTE